MVKKIIFLISIKSYVVVGIAQDTTLIALSSVQEHVQQSNHTLQINAQELQTTLAQYKQTQAAFLPQVSVSHTGTRTNNPVFAFGGKLNQGVFGQSDFAIDALNNPDAITNFTTNIEVKQPIINADTYLQRVEVNKTYRNLQKPRLQLQTQKVRRYLRSQPKCGKSTAGATGVEHHFCRGIWPELRAANCAGGRNKKPLR